MFQLIQWINWVLRMNFWKECNKTKRRVNRTNRNWNNSIIITVSNQQYIKIMMFNQRFLLKVSCMRDFN